MCRRSPCRTHQVGAERRLSSRLAVFDARGRAVATEGVDLGGRRVETWAQTAVGDRARRSGRMEMENVSDTLLAARVVDGPGGERARRRCGRLG